MTKIIFIRHAESDHLIKNDKLRPLTDLGKLSANSIPELFEDISVDYFYCSPYVRSVDTIKYLAQSKLKEIIVKEDFRERKVGDWVNDFMTYANKQWTDYSFKISNGESLSEVQSRNIKVLKSIINEHRNNTIVIGTHGTALCTILNYYNESVDFTFFKSIIDKMPYFIELTFDNLEYVSMNELFKNKFEICKYND